MVVTVQVAWKGDESTVRSIPVTSKEHFLHVFHLQVKLIKCVNLLGESLLLYLLAVLYSAVVVAKIRLDQTLLLVGLDQWCTVDTVVDSQWKPVESKGRPRVIKLLVIFITVIKRL